MALNNGTGTAVLRIPLRTGQNIRTDFPWQALAVSLLLILMTPFTNPWLVWVPIGIEVVRILCYDERVFMTDLVLLLPFSAIFTIPGTGTALGALMILEDAVCVLRRRCLKLTGSFACVLVLVCYLAMRMQNALTTAVFMAAGLVFLALMPERMEPEDALRIVKAFLAGVLLSSVYALIFRGAPQIVAYTAKEAAASMAYQNRHRFSGLMADPNYYSVYLILAVTLILQLYLFRRISAGQYGIILAALCFFGLQTFSRTFFLMACAGFLLTVVVLIRSGHRWAGFLMVGALGAVVWLAAAGKIPVLHVMLSRFSGIKSLNELTTGRMALLMRYLKHICGSFRTVTVGEGLGAGLLGRLGTHNLYVEILYYLGSTGLFLFAGSFLLLLQETRAKNAARPGYGRLFLRILPVIFLLGTYLSLQGIRATAIYGQFFVAFSAMRLPEAPQKDGRADASGRERNRTERRTA